MAHVVLFSTRETANSSERLKTKVAWPSLQSHSDDDVEGERLDNIAMDNCVRDLDTLQGCSDEACLSEMKRITCAWDLCAKYNQRFVKFKYG